jgi:hypothetical protein
MPRDRSGGPRLCRQGHLRPVPRAPTYSWDALAAGITLLTGIVLPFVYPPLRRGIRNSPLLKAGAGALLGTGTRQ